MDRSTSPPDVAGGAPPVVAVVVARAPGPWLEEALASLAAQDYPSLSVLVVDAGGGRNLTARVAGVLPAAYVRAAEGSRGFASAANDVLSIVEGASHFVFCHDDVALAPDAVRVMVEEAFRSNAGIVGPKLVEWERPQRLLAVGTGVDKLAAQSPLVEPGELDQEQHDGVRDVFACPGACLLVRADLFTTIGGFDPLITGPGEDVDLCWRAQVAGARVIVAPDARVRHLEAGHSGLRDGAPTRATITTLGARYRLRTILKCYGVMHLIRVLPQAMLLGLAELIWSGLTANRARARSVVGAWTWNVNHFRDLRSARSFTQRQRNMSDGELRGLQARGSARVAAFLRDQLSSDSGTRSVASMSRSLAGSLRESSYRLPLAVWSAVVVVLLVGSRKLLTG